MRAMIILIIILAMTGGAYAKCQPCPGPSDWSDCTDGKQTRFVYTCSEDTDFKCMSTTEERGCGDDTHATALWIMFIGIIVGLAASTLLLLKSRKKL